MLALSAQQPITLRPGAAGEALSGRVIGFDDATMVVELEAPPAGPAPERLNIELVAEAFLYRSEVAVLHGYGRWWFLARPEAPACERMQRRTFVRIFFDAAAVVMPVTAGGEPDGELTTLQIANLSADGCFAFSDAAFAIDDPVLIFLTIPGLPTTSILSRVVRARLAEDGGWYGIRFEGIPAAFQEDLSRFIEEEIALQQSLGRDITSPVG